MTEWRVILLRPARRYLEQLVKADRQRILDPLLRLEQDPFGTSVKPLEGRPEWSLRVGSRQILLRVDRDQRLLVVTRIGPRGDVYKG